MHRQLYQSYQSKGKMQLIKVVNSKLAFAGTLHNCAFSKFGQVSREGPPYVTLSWIYEGEKKNQANRYGFQYYVHTASSKNTSHIKLTLFWACLSDHEKLISRGQSEKGFSVHLLHLCQQPVWLRAPSHRSQHGRNRWIQRSIQKSNSDCGAEQHVNFQKH